MSRTRDTDLATVATLDYGLSQRALIAIASRTDDLAELITRRLTGLAGSGWRLLGEPAVRAVVRQAVRDVRTAPPPLPEGPREDPALAGLHPVVDDIAASAHAMGELLLEVAPAYLCDTAAGEIPTPRCDAIGESLDCALAARRYVMSGDRRALHGTVL
ncbi:hypothetical protein OTB20_38915 [Streptomyces sp. H27-H1]|uniref:hypothetical protein n=1 Tax=Streptomyces sp. H27-H1 TaxID=2996461 RepID=UPI00226F523E|nr:hypothetical protein [Streptomyces sp. H27-H1]MCY0932042.1 hypothetical protein [Streptomyces sp. H27-H1]